MRIFLHQRRPGDDLIPTAPPNSAAQAPVAARPAPWFGWSCPTCVVDSAPIITAEEAEHLAGVHDRMFHGGMPTSFVTTDRGTR
jgi:hypothetical protein